MKRDWLEDGRVERNDVITMCGKHRRKLEVLSGIKGGNASMPDEFPLSRCSPMLSIHFEGTVWEVLVKAGVVCAD